MCTVTYIPLNKGFCLTSNRDEHFSRTKALPPCEYQINGFKFLYPKDPDQNGSWIVAKSNGDLVVLLNGAYVKHTRREHYRKSRGLIVLDIIQADFPNQFFNLIDLTDIEPFTLVLYTSNCLLECIWDGQEKHQTYLDPKKEYLWSSSTLYNKMAKAKRTSWFSDWSSSINIKKRLNILQFHRYGGNGDLKDGLVMDRAGVIKTFSITNILVQEDKVDMIYHDIKENLEYTHSLRINSTKKSISHKTSELKFLRLKRILIKITNWEYWPMSLIYFPLMPYWIWLGIKSRSFFFFNTSNPGIKNGGFAMENKSQIYELIPQKFSPKTLVFKCGVEIEQINMQLDEAGLIFPIIAKPNIGYQGILVKKIHSQKELVEYIQKIKVDFLLQEFIAFKNEVGIFYYRIPGENMGQISGIVGKEFLTIIGDGMSTIQQLILKEPRFLLQWEVLKRAYSDKLHQVLLRGENYTLVPYGNHARGAKFIDLSQLITEKLRNTLDQVCRQIPGYYFGRMDIMYNTWEELSMGKNFSIIELNGAGSEPTHIYDPSHSLFFAWKEILRHWKILHRISFLNKQLKGLKYMGYSEGIALLKSNSNYLKLVS